MTAAIQYIGDLRTSCNHIKSNSQISTDAPTDNNGKGETFSPTDLVATALASCMITVMGIKAHLSNITFENVKAEVVKVMSADPRRISEIKVNLIIEDQWSDKEKAILENTGLNCPVAKSLSDDLKQNIHFIYK